MVSPQLMELWPAWDPARVLFEDEALLVLDKPVGASCHPTADPDQTHVRERLAAWRPGERYWLAQTMDAELSGVLLFAKQKHASRALAAQLEQGVPKTHLAVVTERRRPAGWELRVVERGLERSLIALSSREPSQPLRRLLRDVLVGEAVPAHRLMLHLAEVQLSHPITGEPLLLRAPIPPAFRHALTAQGELPADERELASRLRAAADRRWAVATPDTDTFRLANSGGDDLFGVEVDRYRDHAVVALRSEEAIERRDAVLDAVHGLGFAGVYVKLRRPHASVLVDTRTDEVAPREPARGRAAPDPLTVREHGLVLRASLGDGLSTGVFLDQRQGRRWVRERGAATVLNLFAYHGAFTVAAVAGGATHTVSVDASQVALDATRQNLALLEQDPAHHELVKADAFGWLRGAAKRGRRFALVVLDPPSFSTTKRSTFRANRDYRALAALALRCVAPGGALLACTNHRGIVRDKLMSELLGAAQDVEVSVRGLTPLADPVDFPPEPGDPCHLKRVVLEVA